MKDCVGPTPCRFTADGWFVRCERLAHSDPSVINKFVIVKLGRRGWRLWTPHGQHTEYGSLADAVDAMDAAVAACG
ncbi:MAG: hypothetical protein Q4F65_11260 [Propionibacteriaceae bacterium]|nr:hypothetical protein [Propionibacteriaceae bacterium]